MTVQRTQYISKRLLQAIPIILCIITINFFLLHLAPGDAVDVLASESGSATPEYLAELRAKYGLDRPIVVQFYFYIKNVLALDLGYSFRNDMPVLDLIVSRAGPSVILMGTTLIASLSLGVLLGLLAATRFRSWADNIISVFALVSYATPLFWIGLMMIVLFSIKLGWLPTSGMQTFGAFHEGLDQILDIARHLILPATALTLFHMALYTRLMRASMLEQANMDYVTTARAKGLTEWMIIFKHVLRNALLPVVTMAGIQIGNLIGGSVVIETVFAWPGLGLLAFESLFARDLNLILGIFLLAALIVVAINFLVDILYSLLDPRISLR